MALPGSPLEANTAENSSGTEPARNAPHVGPRVRRVERLVILLPCLAYVGLAL